MIEILNATKILDAINLALLGPYPDDTVYIDLCPKDFDRPSFLIELIRVDRRRVNFSTIQETDYFTITCFDEVDDYSHSDTLGLLARQQTVLDLFRSGYLAVGDRSVKVKASSGGRDFDRVYIDLQFEYNEAVTDVVDSTPLIAEIITSMKEE